MKILVILDAGGRIRSTFVSPQSWAEDSIETANMCLDQKGYRIEVREVLTEDARELVNDEPDLRREDLERAAEIARDDEKEN